MQRRLSLAEPMPRMIPEYKTISWKSQFKPAWLETHGDLFLSHQSTFQTYQSGCFLYQHPALGRGCCLETVL